MDSLFGKVLCILALALCTIALTYITLVQVEDEQKYEQLVSFIKQYTAEETTKTDSQAFVDNSKMVKQFFKQTKTADQATWILETDPEESMNATQLIKSKGLPCDEHYPHTSDGYILGMQRIPQPSKNLLPVLLIHGLLSSSDCWLTNLINESLAYILHKQGYDVWLGNMRGNRYSKRHESLSPDSLKFWKWSFDEMGQYDIPAMVDHVLSVTGHKQLNYIGHSQGNMVMFIAAISQGEEFVKKINSFIALAPAALVSHMTSPLNYLRYIAKDIDFFYTLFGDGDFLPQNGLMDIVAKLACPHEEKICENVLFLVGGADFHNTNISRVPVYVAHNPAGTSTRNMIHWAQAVTNTGLQIKRFDYGHWYLNVYHYGQRAPPEYDFSKFNIPTYVFCGGQDTLVVPTDCDNLIGVLPSLKTFDFLPSYTHLDFIWAMNSPNVLYNKVAKILNEKSFFV